MTAYDRNRIALVRRTRRPCRRKRDRSPRRPQRRDLDHHRLRVFPGSTRGPHHDGHGKERPPLEDRAVDRRGRRRVLVGRCQRRLSDHPVSSARARQGRRRSAAPDPVPAVRRIRRLSTRSAVLEPAGRRPWRRRSAVVRHRLWRRGHRSAARARQQTLRVPRIENAVADGRSIAPVNDAGLPPLTATIQIDYAALSLSAATKLRFRYMLEGFSERLGLTPDSAARRSTRICRRAHTGFASSATNDGAVDRCAEAVWAFTLQPAFYQTGWFYALCAARRSLAGRASTGGPVSAAVRRQFAVVLAERTRVSREIHDTLLQSLGAVSLELEVLASQVEPSRRVDAGRAAAAAEAGRRVHHVKPASRSGICARRRLERRDSSTRSAPWRDMRDARDRRPDRGGGVADARARARWKSRSSCCGSPGKRINNACPPRTAPTTSRSTLEYRRRLRSPCGCATTAAGFVPADVPADRALRPSEHERARGAASAAGSRSPASPGAGTTIEVVVPVAWAE